MKIYKSKKLYSNFIKIYLKSHNLLIKNFFNILQLNYVINISNLTHNAWLQLKKKILTSTYIDNFLYKYKLK
jgi:hypothetical protein